MPLRMPGVLVSVKLLYIYQNSSLDNVYILVFNYRKVWKGVLVKEYKSKWSSKLFWTLCAFCAGFFIFKLCAKFTHSLLISSIAAVAVIGWLIYKTYVTDNISIILTEDKKFLIKRFNNIIKSLDIDNYFWSEYSKYSNTKDADDQDIYYINKETGEQDSIDCTNFSGDDYEELLTALGAKNQNQEPVKVATTKK